MIAQLLIIAWNMEGSLPCSIIYVYYICYIKYPYPALSTISYQLSSTRNRCSQFSDNLCGHYLGQTRGGGLRLEL